MNLTTVTRRLEIDAGHRLIGHAGKCRHLHGHRYVFELMISAELGADGMVLDFGTVKRVVGGWLDEHWDHGMILQDGDDLVDALGLETVPIVVTVAGRDPEESNELRAYRFVKEPKVFLLNRPPTAEVLAEELLHVASLLLHPVKVVSVVCHETPNCKAEHRRTDW